MKLGKLTLFSLILWTISSLAFTSSEQEIDILSSIKPLSEFSILKQTQEAILDLQYLEYLVKNSQDPKLEERVTKAYLAIEENTNNLIQTLSQIQRAQLDLIYFKNKHSDLLESQSLEIGKAKIFKLEASKFTRTSEINALFLKGESLTNKALKQNQEILFDAYEPVRLAIQNRALKALAGLRSLSKNSTTLSSADQLTKFYNQIIESLFSFGVDISQFGYKKNQTLNGFLFSKDLKNFSIEAYTF